MTTCAIIPTRDERDTVWFSRRVLPYVGHVIVVDDSPEPWHEHLCDSVPRGIEVVRGPGQGLGPAIQRGLILARGRQMHRAVVIDCGASHRPQDIPQVLHHDADVVVGSRFRFGSTYNGGRQWRAAASRAYSAALRARHGHDGTDWTSGFRSYSRRAMSIVGAPRMRCAMHGWQAESLLHAHRSGLEVREVPIHYTAGESSFRFEHAVEALGVLR